MSLIKTTIMFLSLSVFCILSLLLVSPAHAGESSNRCLDGAAAATTMVAGTTLRGYGKELVRIEAHSAGILSLDLLLPAAASDPGRLISEVRADDWTLERSARHLVLAVPAAGNWVFRVAAEDPRRQLDGWRLRAGFVPATITEEPLVTAGGRPAQQLRFHAAGWTKTEEKEIDPDPFAGDGDSGLALVTVSAAGWTKTEEKEIDPDPFACTGSACGGYKTEEKEIDPDPFTGTGGACGGYKTEEKEIDPDPFACTGGACGGYKTEEKEIDPDPFSGCRPPLKTEEKEIDPDPFTGLEVRAFRLLPMGSELAPLAEHRIADPSCVLDASDDHGDTPGCATPLVAGQVLAAELGNGWGDDVDVFAFTLRRARTVRLETRGGIDTLGTLIDRFGHRLATDDDGGTDGGFRLVRVLAPGRYFLRVEGSGGAEGAYQLAFAAERF